MRRLATIDAGFATFDCTAAECFVLNLTANVADAQVKNVTPGVTYTFIFRQTEDGGRIFTWPPNFKNPTQIGPEQGTSTIQNFIGMAGGLLQASSPGTRSEVQ